MNEIDGLLHDGATSRSRPASLQVYADGTVRLRSEGGELSLALGELRIPARLGSTPRRIGLPDGSEFETGDNDAVDTLLVAHGRERESWLHWLESRLTVVTFAAIVVLFAGGLFAVRGIPAIAREAAFALPPRSSAHSSARAHSRSSTGASRRASYPRHSARASRSPSPASPAARPTGTTSSWCSGAATRSAQTRSPCPPAPW